MAYGYRGSARRALKLARRWTPYVRAGFRAYRSMRKASDTKRSQRYSHSGVGVTTQHDARLVYRKRRMPWKKRKRYVRGFRRHTAYSLKLLGTRTQLYNISGSITTDDSAGISSQCYVAIGMYGQTGADTQTVADKFRHNVGMGHLGDIFSKNGEEGNKLIFGSAVMDITLRNTGTDQFEADAYDIVCRSHNPRANFNADLAIAESSTDAIGSSGQLLLRKRGATPFDLSELTKMGYKILTKRKYLLSPGQSCTYQIRDPRNRAVDGGDWLGVGQRWVRRGMTRFVLVVCKNIVGATSAPILTYGVTNKYMYKVWESNSDAGGTNP